MAIGDIQNFAYTGAAQQTTLYFGKAYIIELWGAQGAERRGNPGGLGGYVKVLYRPTQDEVAKIYVGEHPPTDVEGAGGFNGGGAGRDAGGGATDIRIGGTALTNRIAVAGGGGGSTTDSHGGDGGGLVGLDGASYPNGTGGKGGSQSSGGFPNGALGVGGAYVTGYGAGGGGGYYGGGGGNDYSAGGGGSSFIGDLPGKTTAGVNNGHGKCTITEISNEVIKPMGPTTYSYTGDFQTIYLAKGKYKVDCYGAQGANYTAAGGKGGRCSGIIDLSNNTDVNLFVGGHPTGRDGGWNGGGRAYYDWASGGGGATDIRIGGTALTNRILIAAGGGGGSIDSSGIGGAGGGLIGGTGGAGGGAGGTQEAGGGNGSLGQGGAASAVGTGSGGGGYYGGGAGGPNGAGGGGSSYYGTLANPETLEGVNSGDGYIIITPIKTGLAYSVVSQII